MRIRVDDLENAIVKELTAYSQEITDGLKTDVKQVAKECAADIKKRSPKLTGEYRRGWSSKTAYESAEDIRIRVYNRSKYQLTHLLEHGHAKADGGRVAGIPHIRPAEEAAAEKLGKRVKVLVKKS